MITFRSLRSVNFRGPSHRMYTNISNVLTTLPALYSRLLLYGLSTPCVHTFCVYISYFSPVFMRLEKKEIFFFQAYVLYVLDPGDPRSLVRKHTFFSEPPPHGRFKKKVLVLLE